MFLVINGFCIVVLGDDCYGDFVIELELLLIAIVFRTPFVVGGGDLNFSLFPFTLFAFFFLVLLVYPKKSYTLR